jgi:hypothetical protein
MLQIKQITVTLVFYKLLVIKAVGVRACSGVFWYVRACLGGVRACSGLFAFQKNRTAFLQPPFSIFAYA